MSVLQPSSGAGHKRCRSLRCAWAPGTPKREPLKTANWCQLCVCVCVSLTVQTKPKWTPWDMTSQNRLTIVLTTGVTNAIFERTATITILSKVFIYIYIYISILQFHSCCCKPELLSSGKQIKILASCSMLGGNMAVLIGVLLFLQVEVLVYDTGAKSLKEVFLVPVR